MTETTEHHLLAYDTTLRRPGCVLLQAALGGSVEVVNRFPTETWLTAPTPNLRMYAVTGDQIEQLLAMPPASS